MQFCQIKARAINANCTVCHFLGWESCHLPQLSRNLPTSDLPLIQISFREGAGTGQVQN